MYVEPVFKVYYLFNLLILMFKASANVFHQHLSGCNITYKHIYKIHLHSTCNCREFNTGFFKSKIYSKFTITFKAFEALKFIMFVSVMTIFFDIAQATVECV